MRDCANCFHRKPVLKEDGTWTAECEKWDCEFQSRENMIEKTKAMNNDLISRSALIKEINENPELFEKERVYLEGIVLNAPTVETFTKYDLVKAYSKGFDTGVETVERPKGEWIAIEPYIHKTFCPFCKEDTKDEVYGNFCPNCGADMRGEDK